MRAPHTWRSVVAGVLLLAAVGCGTTTGASHRATGPARGCPSGKGHAPCDGVEKSLSPTPTAASSDPTEMASYRGNVQWPSLTNERARAYEMAVVRYVNKDHSPESSPVHSPLDWTVSLMNGVGPSGSPIMLWQLSMPATYMEWSAIQWQAAFNVLENQYLWSTLAVSHYGPLANSQGNAMDQEFQLVAPNGATLRLIDANTIPVNAIEVTAPIPTTALAWSPGSSEFLTPIWSEWIAPVTQYPQLTSQTLKNAAAVMIDIKTSGHLVWSFLHNVGRATSSGLPTNTAVNQTPTSVPPTEAAPVSEPSSGYIGFWTTATITGLSKIDWSTSFAPWRLSRPTLTMATTMPTDIRRYLPPAFPDPTGPFIIATVTTSPTALNGLSGSQLMMAISSINGDVMDAPSGLQDANHLPQPSLLVQVSVGSRSVWWISSMASGYSSPAAMVETGPSGTSLVGTIDQVQAPGSSWWTLSGTDGTALLEFLRGG